MKTTTQSRVAEVLKSKPNATPEYVGRMLSICGDRPARQTIANSLKKLRGYV